jgi:putative transposase
LLNSPWNDFLEGTLTKEGLLSLDVCIEAVEEALARYGKPDIFNTDLGSQFISIPLNVRGAWRDNVFVERLWRTIKYEEVYLHAYNTVPEVPEAHAAIEKYLVF